MLKQFTPGVTNGFSALGPLLYRAFTVTKWLFFHECFVPLMHCLLCLDALLSLRAKGKELPLVTPATFINNVTDPTMEVKVILLKLVTPPLPPQTKLNCEQNGWK